MQMTTSCLGQRKFSLRQTPAGIITMLPSLLILLVGILDKIETHTDIPLPQNISVKWTSAFCLRLSWAPQNLTTNCKYEIILKKELSIMKVNTTYWEGCPPMDRGFLQFSVQTLCSSNSSELAVFNVTYPELLTNWTCYVYSSTHARCSWQPANHTQLRFFYRKQEHNDEEKAVKILQECSSYIYDGDVKTGCNLQITAKEALYLFFNGTRDGVFARNTYYLSTLQVKLLPLNWTVTKAVDKFNISWISPDILPLSEWTFVVKYSECNRQQTATAKGQNSLQINRVPHCQYYFTIQANAHVEKVMESDKRFFESDPSILPYVIIILIPAMCTVLVALSLICFMHNKHKIFTEIPKPLDFISNIPEGDSFYNLYSPTKEEECVITLVVDPDLNKLDS